MLYTTRFIFSHGVIAKCQGFKKHGAWLVVVEHPEVSMLIGDKYIHQSMQEAKQHAAQLIDDEVNRLKQNKRKIIAQMDDIHLS